MHGPHFMISPPLLGFMLGRYSSHIRLKYEELLRQLPLVFTIWDKNSCYHSCVGRVRERPLAKSSIDVDVNAPRLQI